MERRPWSWIAFGIHLASTASASSVDVGKYSPATLSSSVDWTSAAEYTAKTGVQSRWSEMIKRFWLCKKRYNYENACSLQNYVRSYLWNEVKN